MKQIKEEIEKFRETVQQYCALFSVDNFREFFKELADTTADLSTFELVWKSIKYEIDMSITECEEEQLFVNKIYEIG